MADTNKIKYGIKNATIFPATIAADGSATYGTAIPVPGSVSLSLDQQGETNIFWADNIAYYTGVSNNGYEGDWEVAKLPDAVLTEILGFVDDTNGVLIEDANAPVKHFAFAFQFEGDAHARRHILYNCTATKTAVSSATTTQTKDVQTETLNLNAVPLPNGYPHAQATENEATVYAGWYTTPYQYTTTP